jgi:hypothetical protein
MFSVFHLLILVFMGGAVALIILLIRSTTNKNKTLTQKNHPFAANHAAAVTQNPSRAKPGQTFMDFGQKQNELSTMLKRLDDAIDLALKDSKPGQSFKLIPIREAIVSLKNRKQKATHEDELAILFIESRRAFDQVNQVMELPKEFFFRDARQASNDGIRPDKAPRVSQTTHSTTYTSNSIDFWDWYRLAGIFFVTRDGALNETRLRQGVDYVYTEMPDWVEKSGGDAIAANEALAQFETPVNDWRDSPLDSAFQESQKDAEQLLAKSDETKASEITDLENALENESIASNEASAESSTDSSSDSSTDSSTDSMTSY